MNLYFRNTGTSWADPNNWSLTDGGAAAGVIPTATDDVFFTANSSDVFQDTDVLQTIQSLNCTGYTGTLALDTPAGHTAISCSINVGGNVTLSSTMRIVANTNRLLSRFGVTSSSVITTNGTTIPYIMFFNFTTVITLADILNVSDQLAFATNGGVTFTGSFPFITKDLNNGDPTGRTVTLQAGNEYIVKGKYISVNNSGGAHGKLVSSVPGTKAKFTVMGDEQVAYMDYTDIDASGGRPIYSFVGVVTNCININSLVDIVVPPNRTVASSSIL